MAKFLATLPLLVILSSAAFAGPTQAPRTDAGSLHQHRYWLSQDFQRLAFWQAPGQGTQRR